MRMACCVVGYATTVAVEAQHTDAYELRLAAGLQRLHREQLGYFASEVQVHLTHDILIVVIEGPELPMVDPAARARIHDAAGKLVTRVTGREIRGVVQDTEPRPDVHVSILQLSQPDQQRAGSQREAAEGHVAATGDF